MEFVHKLSAYKLLEPNYSNFHDIEDSSFIVLPNLLQIDHQQVFTRLSWKVLRNLCLLQPYQMKVWTLVQGTAQMDGAELLVVTFNESNVVM